MPYDMSLADSVREYLSEIPNIEVEEKEMFSVLNFMVHGKTCVCVSGDKLMLRFDPNRQEELYEWSGYETMLMKGKEYKGYCYINPEGFRDKKDLEYLINICLEYNKVSKNQRNEPRAANISFRQRAGALNGASALFRYIGGSQKKPLIIVLNKF